MSLATAGCERCGAVYQRIEDEDWDREVSLTWCPLCADESARPWERTYPSLVEAAGWWRLDAIGSSTDGSGSDG